MASDSYINFRLRGLPKTYLDESYVRDLVKTVLSITSGQVVIRVRSLADNPVDPESGVATLNLVPVPAQLSDRSKDEWKFDFPTQQDEHEESASRRRRPLVFDTHFKGLTPLHTTPDEECSIDLLATSGLGGHAFGSFKEREGSFMWLRDALPEDLMHARIFIYGYNTQLYGSDSFQSLEDLGTGLRMALKDIKTSHKASHPQRRIILLGHSLGGLVVKEAVVLMHDTGDAGDQTILDCIAAFLFFGVPQQGMDIETLIPLVGDQPNRHLLESLGKNSPVLRRQRREFPQVFGTRSADFFTFYETLRSPTAAKVDNRWKLCGPPAVLVDIPSATHGTNEYQQYPINRSHSEIVKFASPYDEDYRCVLSVLRMARVGSSTSLKAEECVLSPVKVKPDTVNVIYESGHRNGKQRRTITGVDVWGNGNGKRRPTVPDHESSDKALREQGKEEDLIARISSLSKQIYRVYSHVSKRPGYNYKELASASHSMFCALDHAEKHAMVIGKVETEDPAIASQKDALRDTIAEFEPTFNTLRLNLDEVEASGEDALHSDVIDPDIHETLQNHSNTLGLLLALQAWVETRRSVLQLTKIKADIRTRDEENNGLIPPKSGLTRSIGASDGLVIHQHNSPGPVAENTSRGGATERARGARSRTPRLNEVPSVPVITALVATTSGSSRFRTRTKVPASSNAPEDSWVARLSGALETGPFDDRSLKIRAKAFLDVLGNLNVYINRLTLVNRRQFVHRLETGGRMLSLLDTAKQQFGDYQMFKKHFDDYNRQKS